MPTSIFPRRICLRRPGVTGGSPPAAPTSLVATALSSSSIGLTWAAPAGGGQTGYVLERSADGTTGWASIATPSSGATSATDSGLTAETIYYYRLKATNAHGSSAYTSAASDTTEAAADPGDIPMAGPRAGINTQQNLDYATEIHFKDAMKRSRQWASQQPGQPHDGGPTLSYDSNGWPTSITSGCSAEALLFIDINGHYPTGDYTLIWSGTGTVQVKKGSVLLETSSGTPTTVTVPGGNDFLTVNVTATDPSDHVRDIRLILPGYAATYEAEPWYPPFVERWRGVSCLRCMDLMATNHSTQSAWADRPKPTDFSYALKGVPVELLVSLVNELGCDGWFNMPHLATDDYVTQFATYVAANLDTGLRAWVEWSNETWNSGFTQHTYAGAQGIALGLAVVQWEGAWRYTSRRSVEVFALWEAAFGGLSRLVRVLPSQAAVTYISETIMDFEDAHEHADALAIAPYFGMNVAPASTPSESTVAGWDVDDVLDYLETTGLPEAVGWMNSQAVAADARGLLMVAYEGGQHLVGIQGSENNATVTALLIAANGHARMGEILTDYFGAWDAAGGDLFCYYASTYAWNKYGSWGLFQYDDDDPADSVKFQALAAWAATHDQTIGA